MLSHPQCLLCHFCGGDRFFSSHIQMTIFVIVILKKCDYDFHMKIMLKRWQNSKQNPLYLYSYFCARNKCSFLKSDDRLCTVRGLCNSDLTKRWKCDYNFHIKIKQTNWGQNKFILSSYGASTNCQDYGLDPHYLGQPSVQK